MEIKRFVPDIVERLYKAYKQHKILSAIEEKLPDEIYNQKVFQKISFCVTCMNRLFQLKQTILKNIKDNEKYPSCDFIILNYNSRDGLHEWIKENLLEYIKSGIVKYFYTPDPLAWHAAHAKNIAHFLSDGDIVCNLDGDNFTGKDFAFYINYLYNKENQKDLMLNFRKHGYYGTYGRICMKKESFLQLGGYDEELHLVGGEDTDLVQRGIAYGMEYKHIEIANFLKYIENTNMERIKNTNLSKSFAHYNRLNKKRTEKRIAENDLRANSGKSRKVRLYYGLDHVVREFLYAE